MLNYTGIYEQWLDGDLRWDEALEKFAGAYASVEDSLLPLQEAQKTIRTYSSEIVERSAGGRAEVAGFGRFEITKPTIVESYPKARIEQLILELLDEGQTDLAERLRACKERSARVGSLRIVRERERATKGGGSKSKAQREVASNLEEESREEG